MCLPRDLLLRGRGPRRSRQHRWHIDVGEVCGCDCTIKDNGSTGVAGIEGAAFSSGSLGAEDVTEVGDPQKTYSTGASTPVGRAMRSLEEESLRRKTRRLKERLLREFEAKGPEEMEMEPFMEGYVGVGEASGLDTTPDLV